MKKLLATFITLMVLVSCCLIGAFPASAQELSINYDDFDIADGIIIEYLGDGGDVIVPSVDAQGNPINAIDNSAFTGSDVTAVYICEGIEEIGNRCFENCNMLAEVSLPYSLKKIGESCFRFTYLSSLVVPGNVKVIPNCLAVPVTNEQGETLIKFEDLVISYGVEEIRSCALYFDGPEIIFPSTVYSISGFAFTYRKTNLDIYICNPYCEIGGIPAEFQHPKHNTTIEAKVTYSNFGPLVGAWSKGTQVTKIYAPMESEQLREDIQEMDKQFGGFTYVGQAKELLDRKDAENKERSILSSTKYTMSDGKLDVPNNDNSNNNNNNNTNNSVNNNSNNVQNNENTTLTIAILACVTILVIVIAVVVIVIVTNGQKNKKKRRKKKKIAAPTAETETEIVTENLEEASDLNTDNNTNSSEKQ